QPEISPRASRPASSGAGEPRTESRRGLGVLPLPACGERVGVRGSARAANPPSPAGLTRGSILFVRTFFRWIARSSPAVTTAIIAPSPLTRLELSALATLSPQTAGRGCTPSSPRRQLLCHAIAI